MATGTGTGNGTGAGTGTGSAAPPPVPGPTALADTVATAAPPLKPSRPPGRVSPRRLMIAGLAAVAAALLLWGGALLWTRSRPAGPQRDAEEDAHRGRVLELLHEGKQAGEAGNWPVAVYYFRQAEQLEPKGKRLREMRVAAEQKVAQQYSQDAGRASVIAMGVANANQALAAQSWDAAQTAATTVLGIDPQNVEARAILVKAQEGQARRAKQQRRAAAAASQPRPGEQAATAAPVASEAQPPRPAQPAAHPEATTATLRIHFHSEVPEATVVVWANRKEIFRQTYGGRGLFHKGSSGPIDESASKTLPAGTVDFLVNVTPGGKAALVRKPSGNLQGGSSRTLDIQLSGPTQLAVDFR